MPDKILNHLPPSVLCECFGNIDIYLFDQLLRGRIVTGMRIFDAGCGGGRNVVYLLREGFEVFGVDKDARAVQSVRCMAMDALRELADEPDHRLRSDALVADRFRVEPVEATSFPDSFADVVLSSAVLHFARDDEQFHAMLREMWRVLKPSGMLFCRLASSIGIETQVQPLSDRRFLLPDGTERYLVDEKMLLSITEDLGGRLLDPLKTTVVQRQRAMTTWVVKKNQT